jgi:hypothetical protein
MNDNHYSAMFPKEGENKRQGPDGEAKVSEQKRIRRESSHGAGASPQEETESKGEVPGGGEEVDQKRVRFQRSE